MNNLRRPYSGCSWRLGGDDTAMLTIVYLLSHQGVQDVNRKSNLIRYIAVSKWLKTVGKVSNQV